VLLLPAVAVPVAWLSSRVLAVRLRSVLIAVAGFGLVVTPWLVRNYHEFHAWTLSTNQGGTMLGGSCDPSFSGPRAGGWVADCFIDGIKDAIDPVAAAQSNRAPVRNSADLSNRLQAEAIDYMKDHKGQLPQIVALRVGRTWGVARITDTHDYDTLEDRIGGLQWIGYAFNWVLMALTVVGMVLLSRDEWRRWWILVPPIVITTVVAAAFWGTPRFRTGAEPSLVLFAAFALVEGGGRLLRLRRRPVATSGP
jgi:hypothetical protein